MRLTGLIWMVVAVAALAAACGGSGAQRAPMTIRLQPGSYTFHLGGRVVVGDKISCRTAAHAPAGGGYVGRPGHGVASSTGFSLTVSSSGNVKITCPAHPGNV
jgi:hypothetical protein